MTKEIPMTQFSPKEYDLEERTAKLGEDVIKFAKKLPKTSVTNPIIRQLVRAGTGIGANYCEADDAHSKKDFLHKISLCRKESKETKHWLRMVAIALPYLEEEAKKLKREVQELNLIFSSIINKAKRAK
jgi:four helix bundle protein